MESTVREVLQFVEENDVKFVRLAFCDIFGKLKNIAIMPSELPRAFKSGISFDASSIEGFAPVDKSDLFLVPDVGTLSVLPWRPQQGRVVRFFCDVRTADGALYAADGRAILRRVMEQYAALDYECRVGAECEFYLFERDEHGKPTNVPHDNGTYMDVAPLDRGENVRREISLTLEEMSISPESSHHEQGPGQNEVDFRYADPLTAADNVTTFKNVVQNIAMRDGLFASFSPKPIADAAGSGFHVNLSIISHGKNLFAGETEESTAVREHFMAGILAHAPELSAITNPVPGSYNRLGQFEAPRYISWSHQNRSQMVRIPAASGEQCRIEVRSPDVSCNPYHAIAVLLAAGLDGIQKKLPLAPETPYDIYTDNTHALTALPQSLEEALPLTAASALVMQTLGEDVTRRYCELRRAEQNRYDAAQDKAAYARKHYFEEL